MSRSQLQLFSAGPGHDEVLELVHFHYDQGSSITRALYTKGFRCVIRKTMRIFRELLWDALYGTDSDKQVIFDCLEDIHGWITRNVKLGAGNNYIDDERLYFINKMDRDCKHIIKCLRLDWFQEDLDGDVTNFVEGIDSFLEDPDN